MAMRLQKNGVKKQISVDVPQETWIKVRNVAAKNHKSIATWVRGLINKELEKVDSFAEEC